MTIQIPLLSLIKLSLRFYSTKNKVIRLSFEFSKSGAALEISTISVKVSKISVKIVKGFWSESSRISVENPQWFSGHALEDFRLKILKYFNQNPQRFRISNISVKISNISVEISNILVEISNTSVKISNISDKISKISVKISSISLEISNIFVKLSTIPVKISFSVECRTRWPKY